MNQFALFALVAALATAAAAPSADARVDAGMINRIAQADADGDGAVTRAELITFRNAQFERMDRNGDGFLSRADAPRFAGRSLPGFDVAGMVEQFDANHDGFVSRAELASGPTPAFDFADRNQDQIVTEAERQTAATAARR